MINRLMKIPSFLRGELIVLEVDKSSSKLTVDAGNKTSDEVQKAANTLFRAAYKLSTVKTVTN